MTDQLVGLGERVYPALRDLGLGEPVPADQVTPRFNGLRVPEWAYLAVRGLSGLRLNYDDYCAIFKALRAREDLQQAVVSTATLDPDRAEECVRSLLRANLGHLWHWNPDAIRKWVRV